VAGKLALAFAAPSGRPALDRGRLDALTPETITDPDMLDHEIERVRQQGWAGAFEEFTLGISCLGAPIFNQRDERVPTFALVHSLQFLNRRPTRAQVSAIMEAAAGISDVLGLRR